MSKKQKPMKVKRRLTVAALGALFLCVVGFVVFCWFTVGSNDERLFDSVERVPHHKVALVLGCSKLLKDGSRNLFFFYRVRAWLDVNCFRRQPHFLGKPEWIPA